MITSIHNPLVKEIRRLQARRERGLFVAEGEDLLTAARENGWQPRHLLRAGADIDADLLAKVSALGSGSRELGIFKERWAVPSGPVCVALWGIRDPGNVGTIIRSALAFGAASVALGPGTADPYGPKAVRASMGAIFAVAVARVTGIDALPGTRIALHARGGDPLRGPWDHGSGGDVTLLVGSEREGIDATVRAACERTAHLPIAAASESLNAAMAATLALYELSRVTEA